MKVEQLPGCCGILILRDFGYTKYDYEHGVAKPIEKIKEFLELQEYKARQVNYSFLQLTINNMQRRVLKDLFKEQGYKMVARNKHIDQNSTIYIYLKKLHY